MRDVESFTNIEKYMNLAYSFYSTSNKRFYDLVDTTTERVYKLFKLFKVRWVESHNKVSLLHIIDRILWFV